MHKNVLYVFTLVCNSYKMIDNVRHQWGGTRDDFKILLDYTVLFPIIVFDLVISMAGLLHGYRMD